jgi:hypothetical protein
MQRNRNDEVGAGEDGLAVAPEQRTERPGNRSPAVVLQRVHNRAERTVVVAERPPRRDVRPADPAQVTSILRAGRPPRAQRIAADAAERRTEQLDPAPARAAHDRLRGCREGLAAGRARWREYDRQHTVQSSSNHSIHGGLQGLAGPPGNSARSAAGEVQRPCQAALRSNLEEKQDRAQSTQPVYEHSSLPQAGQGGSNCDPFQADGSSGGGVSLTSMRSASPHSRSSE